MRWPVPSARCCVFTVFATASLSLLQLHRLLVLWNMVAMSVLVLCGGVCVRAVIIMFLGYTAGYLTIALA